MPTQGKIREHAELIHERARSRLREVEPGASVEPELEDAAPLVVDRDEPASGAGPAGHADRLAPFTAATGDRAASGLASTTSSTVTAAAALGAASALRAILSRSISPRRSPASPDHC